MDHLEYSQTPGARAKAWAKSNRDFTGLLLVISASPAGKGGWKTVRKQSRFYVRDGQASLDIERREPLWRDDLRRYDQRPHTNGLCETCGRLFLATAITLCWDSAGAVVWACSACALDHALAYVSPSGVFDSAWLTYPRSALATHDRRQGLAIQDLDIRAGAPVVGAAAPALEIQVAAA